ncbi:MAG TPA: acetylglutamate kinase [Ktedonobacterales bacterium]|nr:acetylglutamate kinase [Ktedonobacterales bacterium]
MDDLTEAILSAASKPNGEHHELIIAVLREALPYINRLQKKILVLKLGGSTLERDRDVLEDAIWLRRVGALPVIVHGGGPSITHWLERIGHESRFVDGRRVTDDETLKAAQMVLIGEVNTSLVQQIAQLGGQAIGLSGVSGPCIYARQRDPALGYVGEIVRVDPAPISLLLQSGYLPVIAPLGYGESGECLNINADESAAAIATALEADKLIYLSNVTGIQAADGTLFSELTASAARKLIAEGIIQGGMIPKTEAALQALGSVNRVHIVDGRVPHVLIRELFTDQGAGTMFTPDR